MPKADKSDLMGAAFLFAFSTHERHCTGRGRVIAMEGMEDTSKQEILEAISLLAENVEDLSARTDKRFEKMDGRFDKIEGRLGNIESQMVTKSYLDDKLADMKGDMVSMLRKEDQKVNRLVGVLAEKTVLSKMEAKDVLSFRPFP